MEGKSANRNTDDGGKPPILPDEIIMGNILPKLPVKYLFQFQCVSKHWLASISSSLIRRQLFVMDNMSYSRINRKNPYLLLTEGSVKNKLDFVPIKAIGNEGMMKDYVVKFATDKDVVVDSCNGLVCLHHQIDDNDADSSLRRRECFFEVWNPATRQCARFDCPRGINTCLAYGFGYVPSLDDYKIVASLATQTYYKGDIFRGFYVLSLSSGNWERICASYDYSLTDRKWTKVKINSAEDSKKIKLARNLEEEGLWHEGIIYWPFNLDSSVTDIIGFDVTSNELRQYKILDSWGSLYERVKLFRLKGSLALCGHVIEGSNSEFWKLKDSKDWNSWEKLFSVDLTNVPFITISPTGKCLVGRESEQLTLVEFSKGPLESCKGGRKTSVRAVHHVESHVSPFRMAKSNEEEQKLEAAKRSIRETVPLQRKRPLSCTIQEIDSSGEASDDGESSSHSATDQEDESEAYTTENEDEDEDGDNDDEDGDDEDD